MRTLFLIISLAIGVTTSAQVKLKGKIVNTYKVHTADREAAGESNDCSVRAIASAFDISYQRALELTTKYGRDKGKGMDAKSLVGMVVSELDNEAKHFAVNHINSRRFSKELASEGSSYIVISQRHVHTLKYNSETGKLHLHGDPLDSVLNIIYAIQIK